MSRGKDKQQGVGVARAAAGRAPQTRPAQPARHDPRQRALQPARSIPTAPPPTRPPQHVTPQPRPPVARPTTTTRAAPASTPASKAAGAANRDPRHAPTHAARVSALPARPDMRPAAPPQRPAAVQRLAAKPARARVVQATRFYPNLHPGAVERVETGSLFRLESFTDQYRLRKGNSHGAYVPNQQYNFVRTGEGQMLLHNRYRHPSIAEGRHVLYAGEVFFNNGRLEWWSNGSGHYQPDSEDAAQAGLPLGSFYTYQQVIKGEHKRRGGSKG